MKTTMTSKERILAAIRREPADYVPCCANFNPLTPIQRKRHEWQFPWTPDSSGEEQISYQVEQLGLDQVVNASVSLCRPAPGVESKVWLEGEIFHKVYTTPCGDLHASIRCNDLWPHGKDIPFHSDFNIGHYVEPWLQTEEDLACLKQIQRLCETDEVFEQVRSNYAAAKAIADRYGLATIAHIGSGLTGAMHLFGAKELCTMVIEHPHLVDAYLKHEHQINLRAIELAGEMGVDIIRRNGFYETADFYGPAMLEQFLGKRLRREVEAAHATGAVMSYTIHTGVMPILDYLADLTVDSLFGIDIAFKGMDLPTLRDKLAPAKSFWTGPSSTYHLWEGPDATRRAVRDVFEAFGTVGLILSPCVSAHSIMPWESSLAMIDEWRKLR